MFGDRHAIAVQASVVMLGETLAVLQFVTVGTVEMLVVARFLVLVAQHALQQVLNLFWSVK